MGVTSSKDLKVMFGKKEMKILMLGFEGAGKTTLLYKLQLGEVVTTVPISGFRIESLQYKNVSFTAWDVSTKDKFQQLWKHYFTNKQGLIFVVDSTDKNKIKKARNVLHNILKEDKLKDVPVLVFANKKDLEPNVTMSESEIKEKLDLHSLGDRCHVQLACAKSGDGLYDGLSWLSKSISSKGVM